MSFDPNFIKMGFKSDLLNWQNQGFLKSKVNNF